MIAMRRVIRPIRVRIMRCKQTDPSAVPCDPMQFGNECHHIRHVFNDVIRDHEIEFIVFKRIWNFAKIVDHIGVRTRTNVKTDRTLNLVNAAADIENLHCD